MKIQSLPTPTLNVPMRAPQAQPTVAAGPGDQVTIHSEPNPGDPPPSVPPSVPPPGGDPAPAQPPKKSKFGPIVKGALLGGAALAIPTAIGAATGPWGAVALGVAGVGVALAKGKASGFITLDFRAVGALALGGGGLALGLAGNAFGAPAIGIAAAAGAIAMGGLMAKNG